MKKVWSPASASVRVSASIHPSAPSISGAIFPSRVGTPCQWTIGG
jgi:hypothetical protein